jgi:hypothetical protein
MRTSRAAARVQRLLGGAVIALGFNAAAAAAILGQMPAFGDGHEPTIFELIDAQASSPPPFNDSLGGDPFLDFSASWTFGGIAPGATAATVTIGIFDHDSASPGSQLASFTADGLDIASGLDALFETHGGESGEYNVYSLALPQSVIDALGDGTITFFLALKGPVVTPGLVLADSTVLTDPLVEDNNGAALLFSTLDVDTTPQPIPEPGSFALLALGGLTLLTFTTRVRRSTGTRTQRYEQRETCNV